MGVSLLRWGLTPLSWCSFFLLVIPSTRPADSAQPASHFERLASRPRPTGSEAIAEAREYCADVLETSGFTVVRRPFAYSAFVGTLATPLAGAWLGGAISIAASLASSDKGAAALGVLLVALVTLIAVGKYLSTRGVLSFPAMRRDGINLEAVRGERAPRVWLVAHIDSKWQPVPMAVRAGGVILLSLATIAALLVSVAQWRSGHARGAWTTIVIGAWMGAVPLMLSFVGRRGPGAVDNASGVATALEAAERLDARIPIGVLITDAEELGLAGARAWAESRRDRPAIALNCDGVDDDGLLTVMYSGRRPEVLVAALQHAASREGQPLRVIRMIPGVLTDSVAFAAAGWTTATLSRGSLRTLQRIHTMSDDLAGMRGTGIAVSARVLAGAATVFADEARSGSAVGN